MRIVRGEPVAISGVLTALISLAVILGVNEKVMGGIGVLLGAVISLIVRAGVMPVASVVNVVRTTATATGTAVASTLGATAAGAVGSVSDKAADVVKDVVATVTDTHLKAAELITGGSHA